MTMWSKVIKKTVQGLPAFNDDLLVDFRKRKLGEIDKYLDDVFYEIVKMFDGAMEYKGPPVTLSPKEHIAYMMSDKKIIKKRMEIQENSIKMLRFEFVFQEQSYYMHIHVPYLDPYAISVAGTKYYPQFPIVEKGIHRIKNGVLSKVMKAPLSFWKRNEMVFATTVGKPYREQIITVKIHQGVKRSKATEKTPLILYHLTAYGLTDTLRRYKFKEGEFTLTEQDIKEDGYKNIKVTKDVYFKVSDGCLRSRYKRRFIGSLIVILKFHKRFTLANIIDPNARYFKVVLGKYNQPYHTKDGILFSQAEKHMKSNMNLVDIIAQNQLKQVGINVTCIEELLFEVFYNIDRWIMDYIPNDLYTKRIATLDQMAEELIRGIVKTAYDITNSKQGLTSKTIQRFVKSASKIKWFSSSSMFRSSPQLYNDNYLMSIGAKRFRSVDNPTSKMGSKSKGKSLPVEILISHPSHMACEALTNLPSSSPIISGDINPYAIIDINGNLTKPDYVNNIDTIYD